MIYSLSKVNGVCWSLQTCLLQKKIPDKDFVLKFRYEFVGFMQSEV